jgi:hypothetical protein
MPVPCLGTQYFSENPYFHNSEIWKEYRFAGQGEVLCSPIEWKKTEVSDTSMQLMWFVWFLVCGLWFGFGLFF